MAVQPLQEEPEDGTNRPPLLVPKRENFLSTLRLRQDGQLTGAPDEATSFSNAWPHLRQSNS